MRTSTNPFVRGEWFLEMSRFSKKVECPPSVRLLAFQSGETSGYEKRAIRVHMGACEFCAAESDIYRRFPPLEEFVAAERIPQPLFQLAEALLAGCSETHLGELLRGHHCLSDRLN